MAVLQSESALGESRSRRRGKKGHPALTGEWLISRTNARQRRMVHYWLTILWLTVGVVFWMLLRNALWFVGFMSLYAIWITHLAGWAAETPVEGEDTEAKGEQP